MHNSILLFRSSRQDADKSAIAMALLSKVLFVIKTVFIPEFIPNSKSDIESPTIRLFLKSISSK